MNTLKGMFGTDGDWGRGEERIVEGKVHRIYYFLVYSSYVLLPFHLLSHHLTPSKHRLSGKILKNSQY